MAISWNWTPEQLESHTLVRDKCVLHYWTGGASEQPAVVVLHGTFMNHRMFNAQFPAVLSTHRVLAMDARGHGSSLPFGIRNATVSDFVYDFTAVLDATGVDSAVVVRQGLGAYVAQHALRLHPDRVDGLVVTGASPISKAKDWNQYRGQRGNAWGSLLTPLDAQRHQLARPKSTRIDVQEYAFYSISGISQADMMAIEAAEATAMTLEGFPGFRVDVPCPLMHGEFDRGGEVAADATEWAATDHRIRYVVVPGAGHNANQDHPKFFNGEPEHFLAAGFAS